MRIPVNPHKFRATRKKKRKKKKNQVHNDYFFS